MTDNLAPCPFCGVDLYSCDFDGGKTRYAHAATGCILDRKFLQGESQKAGWNRRTPPPSTHVAPAKHPIVSADRVYKVLKTYRDHGRFDWDHIGYICRDVAALATTEGSTDA